MKRESRLQLLKTVQAPNKNTEIYFEQGGVIAGSCVEKILVFLFWCFTRTLHHIFKNRVPDPENVPTAGIEPTIIP